MTHGHFHGNFCNFLLWNQKNWQFIFFFQNLHLLSFPTIYSLPCFPLKWRAYEFFFRTTRRTTVKIRSNLNCAVKEFRKATTLEHSQKRCRSFSCSFSQKEHFKLSFSPTLFRKSFVAILRCNSFNWNSKCLSLLVYLESIW